MLTLVQAGEKFKLQNQGVTVFSLGCRSSVQMNHGLYFKRDASSDKSVRADQIFLPLMHK